MRRLIPLFVAACGLLPASPTHAQFSPEHTWLRFEILPAQGTTPLGEVVVVAEGVTTQPVGFTDGLEHWRWDNAQNIAWPKHFRLRVASSQTPGSTDPADFETYGHEVFDLDNPIDVPEIQLSSGDRFYEVARRSAAEPETLEPLAWFWFDNNGGNFAPTYFGFPQLDEELISISTSEELRFTSVNPPAEGSVSVYEAALP